MGLLKTAAKVAVASSVHGRIQRRQQARWAAQDQAPADVPTLQLEHESYRGINHSYRTPVDNDSSTSL